MTRAQFARLETILTKIEALQQDTTNSGAKSRLQTAKDELLRLYRETA